MAEEQQQQQQITKFLGNLFILLKKYENNKTKLEEIIRNQENETVDEKIEREKLAELVQSWANQETIMNEETMMNEKRKMNQVDGGGIKSKKKRHYKKSKSKLKSKYRFTKKK